MNKLIGLLCLCLVTFGALTAWAQEEEATTIEGSNYLRWDEGDEVDSRLSNLDYPDNTIARHFIENRLRLDIYRGNLRVGGRLLYFRPSTEDNYRDGLEEVTKIDKRYIEATIYPLTIRGGDFS
ncbi:MAG: hypothetical protein ACOZB3_07990, partial [Calditrichota bacterium]